MRTEKPWGYEELLELNDSYAVKLLLLRKGERCSLQYHERKTETIFVLEGQLSVLCGVDVRVLVAGEWLTIVPGVRHRMAAVYGDVRYLESSSPELDDVVRVGDDYGRG